MCWHMANFLVANFLLSKRNDKYGKFILMHKMSYFNFIVKFYGQVISST
jgi:hypothetical protein